MPIQPIPIQFLGRHSLRSRDPTSTFTRTTGTLERLIHLPLRTGIKESQRIASLERLVVHDTHLHAGHVEDERGRARVVAVDQVRVEFDVGVPSRLDAGVGLGARGGAGDGGEDGARGEIDERVGAAAEGFEAAVYA